MTTFPLKVVRRRQEADDAVSLWLAVSSDLRTAFGYRTGQFITIEDEFDGEWIARQYSLASVPELDENLQIAVKRVPGGRMSTWLVDKIAEGDVLEVASPRGRLYVPADHPRHYVLLAAGSGIVPLLAIARHVLSLDAGHQVTLAYGNRYPDSVMLREEVDALARRQDASVEHVLSRPDDDWRGERGHVDASFLERRWQDWTRPGLPVSAFLCGPEAFMDTAEEFLVERGVDLNDIRKESFALVLNDDESEPDLPVPADYPLDGPEECSSITAVVGGEDIEVMPEPGEPILSALLRVSDDVPFSCQEGTCASCIVRLTKGQVGLRPGVLQTLRPDDLEEGIILACLARPRTESVSINFDDI